MTVDASLVLGVFGAVLGAAGFLYTLTRNRGKDSLEIDHRLTKLETVLEASVRAAEGNESRLTALETKVDVFWRNFANDAARILHSPDPAKARQDYLLEQFMAETITLAETVELVDRMQALIKEHDEETGQRVAAAVILHTIAQRYGITPES